MQWLCAFLETGVTVIAPTRNEAKAGELDKAFGGGRFHAVVGDVSTDPARFASTRSCSELASNEGRVMA